MFDLDHFLSDCVGCLDEVEPRRAIRELLARTVSDPGPVADRMAPESAGITLLHNDDRLTVIDVVWAPGMRIHPHDHRMWAAIGIYAGIEDNAFYRRVPDGDVGLTESGAKRLDTSDVTLLGDDTVHSVANPGSRPTGAIHIYGGDFVNEPRSQFLPPALAEEPYDLDQTRALFAEANAVWKSGSGA